MTEKQAQNLVNFLIKKTNTFDLCAFNHVCSIETSSGLKQLYEPLACLSYYMRFNAALSYSKMTSNISSPIEIKSKLFPFKFKKTCYRRILNKLLKLSSKGYDIFCGSTLLLKHNTSLEQLIIEKDLTSDDKE